MLPVDWQRACDTDGIADADATAHPHSHTTHRELVWFPTLPFKFVVHDVDPFCSYNEERPELETGPMTWREWRLAQE